MMYVATIHNLLPISNEMWIILIGALVCCSCGILGCFLILKRLALMGDAISHAVLPGIVLAAVITGDIHPVAIVIGAGIVGLLTPLLIDSLKNSKLVREDAAIGAVFTFFFAIGVIMVSNMGNIDLDVECVLSGEIATAPFDSWIIKTATHTPLDNDIVGGRITEGINMGPRSFWTLCCVLAINLTFVCLCYKELKIGIFDKMLAKAMGMRPQLLHYILMSLVAITTVASFEAVGVIIVVAMFIAPGATAYLLTKRLAMMLLLSAILGVMCAIFGYAIALLLGGDVSIAGCMALAAGIIFVLAFLFSPEAGLVIRYFKYRQLQHRLMQEHILLALYRNREHGAISTALHTLFVGVSYRNHRVLRAMLRRGLILQEGQDVRLSKEGETKAKAIMRGHRLWETYMHKLGMPPDHVHRSAHEMEHFMTAQLRETITRELDDPQTDPHGKIIPPSKR